VRVLRNAPSILLASLEIWEDEAGWQDAHKEWVEGKNPTADAKWKAGIFMCWMPAPKRRLATYFRRERWKFIWRGIALLGWSMPQSQKMAWFGWWQDNTWNTRGGAGATFLPKAWETRFYRLMYLCGKYNQLFAADRQVIDCFVRGGTFFVRVSDGKVLPILAAMLPSEKGNLTQTWIGQVLRYTEDGKPLRQGKPCSS
jgi:hypothetical protein